MAAELFEKAKTGVFWDAEDCKIPSGLNAILVSKNIRSGLKDTCYLGLTSIFSYGSTEDIMVGFDSSAGYNVAFVQPENQASQILFRLGRRIWLWEKLSLGEGPIRKQKPPNFHYEAKNSSVNFNLLGVGGLACLLIVTTILSRMASS
ncbi:hypothetical protein DY000_02032869 [Brassica cretica]|uniref:Uncharacterized protein n=1 Tax=Brassica cretica TaxID=69181 RepID=A0ABQ7DRG0_BRACR|nr:hypothetical protein DY000_02032869 [Brassica cretica]